MVFVRVLAPLKIFLALLFATACAQSDRVGGLGASAENVVVINTQSGEHRFRVELADDDEKRRVGLMYRTEMAADAGMLFDFEETRPISMWMKNTLIPLDMAFIDKEGVIKRIAANTTPRSLESIRSGEPVLAVLEVNGGTLESLGIKEGDTVAHPMFNSR